MSNWVEACSADDIDEEDVIRFDQGGRTFAIYRSPDDRFFATDGLCTHEQVHLSDGLWVTVRAARIGHATSSGARDIAVTIEETSPIERVALFARAFGLSERESELLRHLATGTDTRELARRMFLSEHTVQDHLKSIFAKTSAHNRRTVLARALGS